MQAGIGWAWPTFSSEPWLEWWAVPTLQGYPCGLSRYRQDRQAKLPTLLPESADSVFTFQPLGLL